ncbi:MULTISPECIES: DUF6402 family protein [Pseudomonas]|jgi:hypothetical protein|uniref:DUF6402 family protein n=1 Tax=Pseudomonas fluorescens TaxID=294 RepID=UPI0011326989|nr:DUF6402 family protein [Pseudomonas fluorescens]TMU82449.1 hypothetical protein FGA82_02845 [Pseudomonas fluorescens]
MNAPAPATTQLTPSSDKAPVEVAVDEFKITDIPDVMRKMGWTEAARLMQRWFDGEPFEMTFDEKEGKLDVSKITQEKLFDDLDFDWLTASSPQTGEEIKELLEKAAYASQYNELVGRVRKFDQLAPGLLQFMKRLRTLGILDQEKKDLKKGEYDFSSMSARELEVATQYNFRSIATDPSDRITNPLDDVYGALGGFLVKFAVTKFTVTSKSKRVPATLHIEEIGCYIRDTYDFLNDSGKDQPLGYWSSESGIKGLTAFGRETFEADSQLYHKVTNDSFNQYRTLHGRGGDLFVYSTVKKLPTSISLRFMEADFGEFLARAKPPKVTP